MTIPEELRDITFDKSAFGYRVDDVDDYFRFAGRKQSYGRKAGDSCRQGCRI